MMLDYQNQKKWNSQLDPWQSPIKLDLKMAEQVKLAAQPLQAETSYQFTSIEHRGNNLQFNGSGRIRLLGRSFIFKQLHFHFPAEHYLNEHQFPCEWHFVHQDAIGHLAVIAFTVKIGDEMLSLNPFYQAFNLAEGQKTNFFAELDLATMLAGQKEGFYNYLGSLTTPPLTRGVEWWVATTPLSATSEQLERLAQLFSSANARDCQPLLKRPIKLYAAQKH